MSRTGEIYPLTAQYEVSESKRTLFDFFLSVEGMYTAYSHERYYISFIFFPFVFSVAYP